LVGEWVGKWMDELVGEWVGEWMSELVGELQPQQLLPRRLFSVRWALVAKKPLCS